MTNKLKRIGLMSGAALLAITPVAVTLSCGTTHKAETKGVSNTDKGSTTEGIGTTRDNGGAVQPAVDNLQPKVDGTKSVSDTTWTEEQQKAEEAANEKAIADAQKAFEDRKAELLKTATEDSKVKLNEAKFITGMMTPEENMAYLNSVYVAATVSTGTAEQVEAKFVELATGLKVTKEQLASLRSTEHNGEHTIFANNMQPFTPNYKAIYTIYDSNAGNGYKSDKFTVFINAIDAYHGMSATSNFQDIIDAIQKAIDILGAA